MIPNCRESFWLQKKENFKTSGSLVEWIKTKNALTISFNKQKIYYVKITNLLKSLEIKKMKKLIAYGLVVVISSCVGSCSSNEDAGNKTGSDRDMLIDTVLAAPATSSDSQRFEKH